MEEAIASFLSALSIEKGFSNNTLDAYRNDLRQFKDFAREQLPKGDGPEPSWSSVDKSLVLNYMVNLRERSYAPATTARKVAAIVLAMWKREERYDAERLVAQATS